jgi:Ca2+-binding EF-hand superfamily protein
MCRVIEIPLPRDELKIAFNKFDMNNNNQITMDEFV